MLKVITEGCEPTIGSEFSACIDLYCAEDKVIGVCEIARIKLGVKIDLDSLAEILFAECIDKTKSKEEVLHQYMKSHYIKLNIRSSFAELGYAIVNGEGIIDFDYKGEIMLLVHKVVQPDDLVGPIDGLNKIEHYYETISKGRKVAQAMICSHDTRLFGISTKEKRTGGFGSTGK